MSTPRSSSVTTAEEETAAEPVDHTADTRKVCAKLRKLTSEKTKNGELRRFMTPLISMATYREAGRTSEANQFRAPARKGMRNLAATVRRDAGKAKDPDLRAVARQAAKDIEGIAASNAFFSGITSMDTWASQMEFVFEAFMPLTDYCRDAGAAL